MDVRGDKLKGMRNVHLVVADLFLPQDFAAEVCAGLHLPALEKILSRGILLDSNAVQSMEALLCSLFSVPDHGNAPVAAISAAFDALGDGCWLRADPVHVRLQREQVVLLPNVQIEASEAASFCGSLNEHFADRGLEFFAPHSNRWYVRLDSMPEITTVPLSQAGGRDIHGSLPTGVEARRWHQIFNEVQMLLFAHPINEAREARGDVSVNSLWFWGGGGQVDVQADFSCASSDEVMVQMLCNSPGIPFAAWSRAWDASGANGASELLVWSGLRAALQRGDLSAWRCALQDFETGYAAPLWQALRAGRIAHLQVDVQGGDNLRKIALTRGDSWAFWRKSKPLADYSVA